MEVDEPFTPKGSRRSMLTRSLSAQPEEWALSSSPYSARRKPKSPGRSLTAIFTHPERKERASSEDNNIPYRRKTIGACFTDSKRFTPVQEFEEISMNTSMSERNFHPNNSVLIYPDLDNLEDNHRSSRQSYYANAHEQSNSYDLLIPASNGNSLRRRKVIPSNNSSVDDEPSSKSDSKVYAFLKRICKFFFWCFIIIVLCILTILGLSTFFVYQKSQCEHRLSMKVPLDTLRDQLESHVIGQDLATQVLLDSLKELETDDSKEPLLMWMVGWTGSGKTHTINIVKNLFPDPSQIRIFIPSLLMLSSSNLQKDISGMLKNLDSCSPKLIIIDGWDEEDEISINILHSLLKEFKNHAKDSITAKMIIIVSGTEGSKEINREYLKLRLAGNYRKDLRLGDFKDVTRKIVGARKLDHMKKKLVVIPFLPLEKIHVEHCIIQEMERMQLKIDDESENMSLTVVAEVVKQIQFLPPNRPLVSATGCKRVQPLLRLLSPELK